ncbi:hypothetical protein Y695_03535 [Hydrogenophaga sp. T4]|nr:hypothetical protein Y695_03535 [Hydrogenophaga sp. T4]
MQAAPASAQNRNTLRAEKRSAMASKANTSVPTMKPNCSDDVSGPTALAGQPSSRCRSGITAFTANHSEVPANCASTSIGRMWRGILACCGVMVPSLPVRRFVGLAPGGVGTGAGWVRRKAPCHVQGRKTVRR